MTNIDLDKLEQLHANATPGPWTTSPFLDTYEIRDAGDVLRADRCGPLDAEWIAAMHNAAPALIAELREARATIERVLALADSPHHAYEVATDTFNESGPVVWVAELRAALDGDQ